jgi:hypothetical protein
MERKARSIQQNKDKNAIDFIQEHDLAREVDRKPALTSKGEKMLSELQESLGQSNTSSPDPSSSNLSSSDPSSSDLSSSGAPQ